MKITQNIENVYKTLTPKRVDKKEIAEIKEESKGKTETFDKVTLSNNDQKVDNRKAEVDFIKRKLAETSSSRQERIADIKNQIKSGTYDIDLNKVADAILNQGN